MIDDPRYLLPSTATGDAAKLLPASEALSEWGAPLVDPPDSWTTWGASIIPSTVSSIIPAAPNLDEYAAYMKALHRRAEHARVAFDEAVHAPTFPIAPTSPNALGLTLLALGAAGVVAGLLMPESSSSKR